MDAELAQIERHERSIGPGTHPDRASGVEHQEPGTVGSDATEYVDVAHRRSSSQPSAVEPTAGR